MKLTKLLAMLAFASVLMLTSCEDDPVDPVDEYTKPAAPTAFMANSFNTDGDEATISLKWTASTDEGTNNFTRYELTVLNSNGAPVGNTINITTENPYTLDATNLDQGAVYTFELRAVNPDFESDSVVIEWSPAWRFTEDAGAPIELYGSQSNFGSGLQFYSGTAGPSVLTVGEGANWNIGFDDKDGKLLIGSASELSYSITPKDAEIFDVPWEGVTLNSQFFSKALNDASYAYSPGTIDLTQYNSDIIFLARVETSLGTNVYNYVRVFVDYDEANNTFVRDAGTSNQYIVVELSYQAEENVPYAKIGQAK